MVKLLLALLIFLFFSLNSNAQALTGVIVYKMSNIIDTLKMNNYNFSEGTLYFDASSKKSVYVTDRVANLEPSKHSYEKKDDGSTEVKTTGKVGDKLGKVIYKSYNEKILVFRDGFSRKPFIVKDTLPDINWAILDSTKKIKDLLCQKAEGDFRGRHYTAWFTNKILIQDGPWKLCGLPGLILEAYDEKKQFIFETQSIEFPKEITEALKPPFGGEEIDFTNYHKGLLKAFEDADKKIKAMLYEDGGSNSFGKLSYNFIERNLDN